MELVVIGRGIDAEGSSIVTEAGGSGGLNKYGAIHEPR